MLTMAMEGRLSVAVSSGGGIAEILCGKTSEQPSCALVRVPVVCRPNELVCPLTLCVTHLRSLRPLFSLSLALALSETINQLHWPLRTHKLFY